MNSRAIADEKQEDSPLLPTILEMGWLLAALLTTLWINLWGSQPFDPAKISLLRWLVWLMVAIWLADWLLRPRSWRDELPPPLFLLPWLALALVAIVSSFTAANSSLAVWGSQQRANGLLTLLTYLLLALLVASRLRSLSQVRRLMLFLMGTAVPILFLSSLQLSGNDPFHLVSDARSPIYATLGRSNFVGAYLAMLLPLTLALALTDSRRSVHIGLGLLALGQLLFVGLTLVRSAWLAAAVGLLIFLGGWLWPRLSRRRRWGFVGANGLLLVAGSLLAVRGLVMAEGGSVAARRVIWQATLTLIGERPLLGYGLDNLAPQFLRLYPAELVYYQGRQVFVDYAHNWLLDTTVSLGLLGLLALLWLWGVIFSYGWRELRRLVAAGQRERSILLLGCLAAIGGNLSGNLVGFDVAATSVTSWLLVAVIIYLGRQPLATVEPDLAANPARWRWGMAGLLLVVTVWVGWWGNGRFLAADIAHQRSLDLTNRSAWQPATVAAHQAVRLWPQEPAHWQHLARLQGLQGDLAAAGQSWQQAISLRPVDPIIWVDMGQFYFELAQQGQFDGLIRAEAAFIQAAALAPNSARIYMSLGNIYQLAGEPELAAYYLEWAVYMDASDDLAQHHLDQLYLVQGRLPAAQNARHLVNLFQRSPAARTESVTYQGLLTDHGGYPLSGEFTMQFTLYDSPTADTIFVDSGPLPISVTNGLFTVALPVPQVVFAGQGAWLALRIDGETLLPWQPITPVVYALSLPSSITTTERTTGHAVPAVVELTDVVVANNPTYISLYGQSASFAVRGLKGGAGP
jgi:O-antigen ligase/Tfp pilus assembly protein PilF